MDTKDSAASSHNSNSANNYSSNNQSSISSNNSSASSSANYNSFDRNGDAKASIGGQTTLDWRNVRNKQNNGDSILSRNYGSARACTGGDSGGGGGDSGAKLSIKSSNSARVRSPDLRGNRGIAGRGGGGGGEGGCGGGDGGENGRAIARTTTTSTNADPWKYIQA